MSGRACPGVGLGFDVHRFGGRGPLVLGGVEVPHREGLLGHSDADVLCHAVADAILGAAALGDLGEHFPSSDQRWRGVSSLHLLELVLELMAPWRLQVRGVDSTLIAEAPRLQPYRQQMAKTMGEALGLAAGACSVKIKSTDGLGSTGRGEGIAALEIATVG